MSKAKEWGERLERLVEAYEQRIADLENQLATPPECVVKLLEATKFRSDETGMLGAAVAQHYGMELTPGPPTPQPGEVWECVLVDGGEARAGEIVSTRGGLVYLLDLAGFGSPSAVFVVGSDGILRNRRWRDRKLTRRVS